MIATVTLNPAVDKTCKIKSLRMGEVNRLESSTSQAGGKGINVTRVLRQFHIPVMTLGFLGGNNGRFIEEAVEKLGAECFFTNVSGETRVNTNILSEDGMVTEILEPGPIITEKELQHFLRCYEGALEQCRMVVLSGSLPQGIPMDIYAVLIERARLYGVKTLLDTSGEALRIGIKAKPYMIKPNHHELAYLAGKQVLTRDEMITEARKIIAGGISKVVVSLGSEGMLYVDGEQSLFAPAKPVQVMNTVGCGDTAVASFCMSEMAEDASDVALKKAVALAAANAAGAGSGEISMDIYLDLL